MTDAATKLMTVAEFLEWDDGTDTRHELVSGRVVAMAPVSPNHSMIASKIVGILENALKRPCYVGIEAGVVRPDRSDSFYDADIVVSCSPWQKGMPTIPQPVVVIEVLSPSTIEYDRGRKAYDYSQIELGPGDRPGVERAAPCRDLAATRYQVGGRERDRRRGARARVRGRHDPLCRDLCRQWRVSRAGVAMAEFATKALNPEADVIAPDGCEVRILAVAPRGSMAHFTLGPGEVARAVCHRTVEELWYFLAGQGQMWRRLGERSEIVEVVPGVSIAIPTGTWFQLRNDGAGPLSAVAVTMPPWPGEDEAYFVDGAWQPNVG